MHKARPLLIGLKNGVWSGIRGAPDVLKKGANDKRRDGIGRGEMTGYVLGESPVNKYDPFRDPYLFGAGNQTRTRDPNLGKVVRFLDISGNCAGFRPIPTYGVPISANSRDFRL